ncbi:hypothetical protein L2E82_18371 [Cichorium intybus]|uniref:Uncharacterized protein n=1 Tax=Cichorium intybus TaxID=13427 RepID=A0ACB9F9Y0_CICIN|nr:hypothetical protein L2E82_18371 [Cichorium intybus]
MEALRNACAVTGVDDSVDALSKPSIADRDYVSSCVRLYRTTMMITETILKLSVPFNGDSRSTTVKFGLVFIFRFSSSA